jgi:galactose mutarotase-like enzyme
MDLGVSTDWSYRGLRTVILENRHLRVVVLPEAGARIWQITHKPTESDLLWNNPRSPPAQLPIGSRYDDVWSGGWDELFPNDEATPIDAEAYPDHGEVWTSPWQAQTFCAGDEVGVHLRLVTPISAISMEKTIRLRRDDSRISFRHTLTNPGFASFPFLWKLHPALAVTPRHRIDFPPMKVTLEPGFPGTLGEAPPIFDWPYAKVRGRTIDLRQIPPASARQLYFFYGTQMQAGWCALTNMDTRLACALVFDPKVFQSCWLFASYGGWRSHNVAVLEPCTGYPVNFDAMRAAGRHRTLAPGESLTTEVQFVLRQGIRSVTRVDADGTIVGD